MFRMRQSRMEKLENRCVVSRELLKGVRMMRLGTSDGLTAATSAPHIAWDLFRRDLPGKDVRAAS